MKKITLLLLFILFSVTGYSQLSEGFESTTGPDALPSTNWTLGSGNWAVFDNGVGTVQRWGNTLVGTAFQGDNAAYVNRENLGTEGLVSQDYLSTPLVTIPANGQLRFFARSFASGNQGTLYQIRVAPSSASQTNPAAYNLVQQWTEETLSTTFNVYEEKIVDLSAFASQQVYVSFVRVHTQLPGGINGAGDRWLVDNVNIVQRCLEPTNLTFSAITQNSATLNWANPSGATSWEIEIILATATPTGTGVIYNGTLPYLATGLLPNTAYKFYVRALCNTGFSSDWSPASANFTTGTAPPECGGNFVDAGGPTANYPNNSNTTTTICPTIPGEKVTVTFTSFNTEATWDGLYVYNGSGVVPANLIASANPAGNVPGGLAGSYWGTTIPGPFTSSAADGCLTFVFRSDASVNNPGWVANITCAPPPACQQPTTLVSSAVTSNSATLAWTNVGVATTWEVIALPCTAPAPDASTTGFITTSTNPYTFTGLAPATCYNLYVRGNCSTTSNGVSAWSGPRSVTTLVAPPECGGNFVDAGGPTANYPNNSNTTTTICPTIPGEKVTVTFTSFNTEATWDGLYVYDGNGVVPANLIASANPAGNVPGGLAGSYWGTTIPGPFTSSAADGCLTFVFRSDGAVNNPGWVANITCAPPPACQQPTTLVSSAVTSNSATLAWTNVGVATTWEVIALPCTAPAPDASTTGFITTSTNPYTFTGLAPATCYNLYVRGNCSTTSNGVSAWSGPRTVTTLVAPPECGGNFVDAGGPTANYPNSSNTTTIICPTNPGEIVTVTFTAFNTEATWDGLYVYNGNGVVPANLIASANPAGNVPGGLAGSYWGTTIPGPFTSTAADGCLTFVFRSDASVNNPGWVSNITCSPAPTCARPTLVNATNVTQTSAVLSWTQPLNPDGSLATSWEVLVLPAGSPVPTTSGIPATSPYTAAGLSPGTAYVFYVRAICSGSDTSTWAPLNFAAKPVNDECSNATFAIVNQNLNCVQTTPGTLSGATGSLPATTCPGDANDDVWFTFTATAVTHVISFNNVSLPAPTLNYAIFSGSDCGALTQVGCNSGANLVPGTTYFIRVYSATALPQFTTFNLCIGTLPCAEAPAFCTGQTVTYANATNVPSLGQIGCLGSSPNPAFFFLQVNQAGPLSYLISQVTTAGAPIDVDYVIWGPFTDLNAACSGVPANPLPQAVPLPTPATGCPGTLHGCSFSAAPQEIMCIPNAQLCQVYVVMITNFSNQAGTVTFSQTNTGGGTTECFPINTFNYPQTFYCQNGTNPTPVLSPGAAAGTYTSTPGLVIDPVTGVIDLAASTPGPYIVTSTTLTSTAGVCTNIPSIITTRTVVITAAATATIAYASPTYCNSITSFENPVLTGTTGGVYSASPAGLQIDAVTGGILPIASTPGIYTVTYTIPAFGGCAAFSTTVQVEILASPVIAQQANVSVCNSYTLPALTVGSYYSQAGGVGVPLDINVPLISSQTVYVYANNNGCSNERSFNVSIGQAPTPTLNVTQTTCSVQTGTIEVIAPIGTASGLPANLFISEVTDAATGSLTYVEIYNGTGTSVDLSNYKLKVYNNGGTTPNCDLLLSGTIANNATNIIKLSSDANVAGVTPSQSFTGCGGVNTDDNIRLTTSSDVEVDIWGRIDGVSFTPLNQPGYTYRRNNNATVPSLTWNAADWTALDPENYSNLGSFTSLVTGFQYSIDGGAFQSGTIFNNVAPGDHTITVLDLASGCLSVPVAVIINPVPVTPTVLTFSYATPVCKNATTNPTPITVSGFTQNGVYSSTTGLSIDPATGVINLANSNAGTYIVTYTVTPIPSICLAGGSATFEIVINPVITPNTSFSYSSPICSLYSDNLAQPILSSGFTSGGVFSSTAGLSINPSSGVITVSGSSPGIYTITYFIAANPLTCQLEATGTAQVTIVAPFEISVEAGCQSVSYVLTALPVGNSFNPETVSYSWQNSSGVIVGDTQSITVTEIGNYFVSITSDGCSSNSLPTTVSTINCVIQKGISVNNDGKNDTFDLSGYNVRKLSIYNRLGVKAYSKNNYINEWGGQSDSGDELPDGTYYYVIERNDGETKTGWIYINREQ
jgi:gliding motility-associated-like protein